MPHRPAACARPLALLALLAALAACVPPAPEPTPLPSPAPSPIASAVPTPAPSPMIQPAPVNWIDAPQTPGDWTWRREGTASLAQFAATGGQVLLRIACAQGQVVLSRAGGGAGSMVVQAETASRTLSASASGGGSQAALAASDPLLDAIALSRGRFAVSAAGQPTLYLPAWPEITRVVEDCRE